MRGTPWTVGAAGLGALLMLMGGLAGLLASCNESSESDMYQQMMASGTSSAQQQSSTAADKPPAGLPTEAPATSADDEATEVVLVPVENLIIENVDVKAPYPEYDGEGRYDVKVHVMTEEYAEPQVYRIVALDEEGNEVGSQEKHLKLPQKKARSFNFNGFYCTHMPTTVAFYVTNKQAVASTGGGTGQQMAGGSAGAVEAGVSTAGDGSGGEEDEDD